MKNIEPSEPSGTRSTLSDSRDAWRICPSDHGGSRAPRPSLECPSAGAKIAQYEVVRALGRGGTADVVLARDTRLDRLVALKLPRRRRRAVERLLGEARVLACLRHEGVVTVHEVSLSSSRPYMTLEYVGGQTLREVARAGRLSPAAALKVMSQLLRAVAHVHDSGFVHRDLKPENIMFTEDGRVKLLDFGLSRRADDAAEPSEQRGSTWPEKAPVGTLLYMSPEQLRSERIGAHMDVWALGLILCELLDGKHPFSPFEPGWLSRLADRRAPVPRSARGTGLRGELDEIVSRCLEKRVSDRFRSAGEIQDSLSRLISPPPAEGTWQAKVAALKQSLARSAYEIHGSYSAAARALAVGRSTLRRHAPP